MTERVQWEDLPAGLREAVTARTGPVVTSETVAEGLNCTVALIIHTRRAGPLFLKGVRTSDATGTAGLRAEEHVNGVVAAHGSALRHRFEAAGWRCLAFAHLDGRHVDLSPGTGDLDAVARTLERVQSLDAGGLRIPRFAERFRKYLEPGEAEALEGAALLHTDANPHNILVRAGDAYLVDWAMPATGPAWVDPAYTAVRMMECGQTPADALRWLHRFPGWRRAEPGAVRAFVNGTCRHWTATVGEKGAGPSNARFRSLLG
ncbi:phosphotransferase family protein [Streptomyces sp. NPDC051567]|uniref:phosphotransferase family protein n=1 Tax=Streptomyces sp. NPDC051567 TaxID=3365660 RepID=UPI0037B264EF